MPEAKIGAPEGAPFRTYSRDNVGQLLVPRRFEWNSAQANICKRRHVAKTAEFCSFQKVARLAKPPIESSLSVMKPISCHQSHGGHRSHERPHVKAIAAVGGGRKASLYMGPLMRTSSPMRLGLPKHHAAHRNIPRQNLLRFHLKRQGTQLF